MNENNIFLPAKLPSNESRRLEAVRRTGELDVDNKDLFIVFNELQNKFQICLSVILGSWIKTDSFFYVILVCQMISR